MPKFFLIDQSLEGMGGHHFDYANCITQAVQQAGWDPYVAAHCRFKAVDSFPKTVRTASVFRNTTYSKCSYLAGLATMARQPLTSSPCPPSTNPFSDLPRRFWSSWTARRLYRRRRLLIRQFAADCESFFAPHVFEDEDQVLLAGVSEIELMGLAAFLCNHPRTNQVRWNVLLHFNVFNGWPADYANQFQTAQRVRRCFESALARIPFHDIHFYTTTPELADQFNLLRVAPFKLSTYPINSQIASKTNPRRKPESPANPLRLTLAGAIRREKGQCQVAQSLVDELWSDYFRDGRIELQIQRPVRSRFVRPKIAIELPEPPTHQSTPVRYFQHPLSPTAYAELIQSTDIGLLAYDPAVYYARRAGILGEYLAAGKPVIVLGGSWLAEHLQAVQQRHVRTVIEQSSIPQTYSLENMCYASDNVPQHGGVITFDQERRPFQASLDVGQPIDALAVEYSCLFPTQPGTFVRIELLQLDQTKNQLKSQVACIGTRDASSSLAALFQIDSRATQLKISFANACDDSSISVRNLRAIGLCTDGQPVPRSAVGFVAADASQLADAVREIILHYAHYRTSAEAFAPRYRADHSPDKTAAEFLLRHVARAKSA